MLAWWKLFSEYIFVILVTVIFVNHTGVFKTAHVPYYPRVTSFDALKQSTYICAHLITFSSRKNIKLNKLSCFKSNHTFWEVREYRFCLKYRCQRVEVCRHNLFWQTAVSTPFIGCWRKRLFHCSSVFTGCTLYCTRKTKDYQLKFNKANSVWGHLILKWFKQCFLIKTYSINKTHELLHTKNTTCTIQHSGIWSFWENLVTWFLRHQMKNEWELLT
mgnify:CR=1 FL=1